MKAKKYVLAMAIVFGLGMFASCSTSSTAEEDELYDELSIDKDEIKLGDT
jgi:hypothetical protein